jgi:hypothetical protein
MAKYVIRAQMVPHGENSFVAKAIARPLDSDAPLIREIEPCEPCTYPQARTACYKFVARLSYEISKAGGEIVDVLIEDAPGD